MSLRQSRAFSAASGGNPKCEDKKKWIFCGQSEWINHSSVLGPLGQRKVRSIFWGGAVWHESVTYGSFEKGVRPPIRPDERSTELHPYSPGPCTSLSPGGWPPILDLPISHQIPGSIRFSIKVILFLFLYIWVRAAFPRYRYDQLMGPGRKVFLPLSLARVVPVSGVLVTFRWLP
jgi:hypothetical protein